MRAVTMVRIVNEDGKKEMKWENVSEDDKKGQ